MPKKRSIRVDLPNLHPYVDLPATQAETLTLIIAAGPVGISSLELRDAGLVSIHNHLGELRALGAVFHTETKSVNWKGRDHPRIGHYTYQGWTTAKWPLV